MTQTKGTSEATMIYNDGFDHDSNNLHGVIATSAGNLISGPLDVIMDLLANTPGIDLTPRIGHMAINGHDDFRTVTAMTKDAAMALVLA